MNTKRPVLIAIAAVFVVLLVAIILWSSGGDSSQTKGRANLSPNEALLMDVVFFLQGVLDHTRRALV